MFIFKCVKTVFRGTPDMIYLEYMRYYQLYYRMQELLLRFVGALSDHNLTFRYLSKNNF